MKQDSSPDNARLEAWLASSTPPEPPAALRAAILASASHHAVGTPSLSWAGALHAFWLELGGLRIAAPACALALGIGISVGNGLLQAGMYAPEPTEDLLSLALIQDDYRLLVP